MLLTKLSALIICVTIKNFEAARILAFYPTPSFSHQIVFRPITLELLKRGHEVTVVTADPMFTKDNAPKNLIEIDCHDILYNIIRRKFTTVAVNGRKNDLLRQLSLTVDLTSEIFEEQAKTSAFQELINNKTQSFDLLLLEALITPALGLYHRFKAPIILFSSFGPTPFNYEVVGAPSHPILYHNIFRQRLYNLTLWEKVQECYNQIRIKLLFSNGENKYNSMLKRVLGESVPPLSVLKENVDMLFVNMHPIWEGSYPVPPNVIYLGGVHQKSAEKLPLDLQEYLDASNNGVIYFSLGTNVDPTLLSEEKISIFKNVFSGLPFNVIWKWTNETISGISGNVRTYKWLPQADLLKHPNVKVFITQGGLQSTDEAITAGVPLIGVPMLGDQWYNVEKYVHHGIGVMLKLEGLSEDQLRSAIIETTQNERYRENIIRLRTLMSDQPQTPLERGIWWIEHVLRHGGAKHLRAPAANMSWSEYLEIELVSVLLLCSVLIIILAILVIRFVVQCIISHSHILNFKKLKKL
ncbi:UDP-glycosyltransferase UGT5-like [Battus philenor]|uniref:UDP-glycosyltransferase UGT5-like n=1 Tax=Battus philenor TaxID=42288 RepID=UPI0035CF3409